MLNHRSKSLTRRQALKQDFAAALSLLIHPSSFPHRTATGRRGFTRPTFDTDDQTLQAKYNAAVAGLARNQGFVFRFPRPVLKEGATYAGVWLESGPQEGLLYSAFRPDVALDNHLVFFDLQRADGYLPCCVRVDRIESSQIQMVVPIAATALELFERLQDEELLVRAYRACSAWDRWLMRYRNTRGTGLCEAFCGFDTGEDKSPRFRGLPWKCPNDDARVCPKVGALPYLAPDLSATVYGGRLALARMAKRLNKPGEAARWEEMAAGIRRAIMKWCFDPEDVCFYDRDARNRLVRILCVELIVVLGERVVDQHLFDDIYRRHIHHPNEFWTPYPFPSVAVSDPAFDHAMPADCWGGPSQVLTALRAPRWMEYYGKTADLTQLMQAWVHAMTAASGFEQQVNPWTGEFTTGYAYSPAMLLLVDFFSRLYGVHQAGNILQWNCRLPGNANRSSFSLPTKHGDAQLTVRTENGKQVSELAVAGKRKLTVEGTVRVNTSATGEPLRLLGTEPLPVELVLKWPNGPVRRKRILPDESVAVDP